MTVATLAKTSRQNDLERKLPSKWIMTVVSDLILRPPVYVCPRLQGWVWEYRELWDQKGDEWKARERCKMHQKYSRRLP